MLTPNPKNRPSIHEILNILGQWQNISKVPLNSEA